MRAWLLFFLIGAAVAAPPPVLEVELRWVAWRAGAEAGTLSTATPARDAHSLGTTPQDIQPLAQALRVQAGERAEWELTLADQPSGLAWAQITHGPARVLTPLREAEGRWRLAVTPQWRGEREPLQVELDWQQPEGASGQQRWRSRLPVKLDHWVTVARSGAAAPAPVPGSLSTHRQPAQRELQLRLRRLAE
jgi:hypothetical protein